jgi:hypothetical protein
MRWITYAALAIALVLIAPSPARAVGMTGNELLTYCEDSRNHLFCRGYIGGIADIMQHLTANDPNGTNARDNLTWCPDDGVTASQLADMVRRRLRDEPEFRHHRAYMLVTIYLGLTFPCD